MAPNRSSGGQSEYVRKASEFDSNYAAPESPAAGIEACHLLTTLMNVTLRQLNTRMVQSGSLSLQEAEAAELLAYQARIYQRHLEQADPLAAATSTSEDLLRMKALIGEIHDSRRLNDILATSNIMLAQDNVTYSRSLQEIWLGRRAAPDQPYYLSARVITYPYFDASPPLGQPASVF